MYEWPDLTQDEIDLLLFGDEVEARALQRARKRSARMVVDGAALKSPAMRGKGKETAPSRAASPGGLLMGVAPVLDDYLAGIFVAFDVLPSEIGVREPLIESVVSLKRQRKAEALRNRRAPGDWEAEYGWSSLELVQLSLAIEARVAKYAADLAAHPLG